MGAEIAYCNFMETGKVDITKLVKIKNPEKGEETIIFKIVKNIYVDCLP